MLRIICLLGFLASCRPVPEDFLARRTIMKLVTSTPIPKRHPAVGGVRVARLGALAAPALQWHAGVYSKMSTPYSQICGGTIVERDVIISAAHCFWGDDIGQLSAGLFAVAAGKLLRAWDAVEDAYAQLSDVTTIHLPVRFRGQTTSFQDDIAVVRLSTPLEYGPGVQPVCVTFQPDLEKHLLQTGKSGTITGWGLTQENGDPARHLNYLDLPYIDTEECFLRVEADFLKYLTSDKICAGYWDAGMALCQGDSGGGYIFKSKVADSLTAPYILGIASTAQRAAEKQCNAYTPASFTQVSFHKTFLQYHVPGIEEECGSVYASNSSALATNTTSTTPSPSMTASTPTKSAPTLTETSSTLIKSPTPTSTPKSESGELPKPAAPQLQWHAAIYLKTLTEYKHVCGGSVVKRDVIISAAHCFHEQFHSTNASFVAAAGKLLKAYDASEDTYAQYSDIKTVSFPKTYKGEETYYQDDIAVVQLSDPFRYTAGLQPLCVSFDTALAQPDQWRESDGKSASTYQRLTGWSLSDFSYGGSPPTLESQAVPMVENSHCQESYGHTFSKFLTSDKICAGFWTTAKALCQGDSGSGLSHYSFIRNTTLAPYLFAVASTLQGLDKKCLVPEFSPASFTGIRSHEEFLKEQVPGLEEECGDVYLDRDQSARKEESNQGGRNELEVAAKENSTVQNENSSVITPVHTSPNPEAPRLPLQSIQTIADAVKQPKPERVRISADNGTITITVTSVHTITFELPRAVLN